MFFPPDPDSDIEMRLIFGMVAALSRANEWVFVALVAMLICYVFGRLVLRLASYLFEVYKQKAFTSAPHNHIFRITLAVGGSVLFVGLLLALMEETRELGLAVLCIGFAVFSITSTALDWHFERAQGAPTPALETITLDNLVTWKTQSNANKGS